LWVVWSDMVRKGGRWVLPAMFEEAIVGHRMTVGWCDQEATLEHCVPCGFLNHYSWNSRVHT
jgi:hypothetical protein